MASKPDDTNPNTGYDETAPPDSEPPNPGGTRKRPPNSRTAHRPKPAITEIRIARIETVTMTAAEYDNAVEALAVLINRWWHQHPDHHHHPRQAA
jgi:hypothetical protein